MQLNEYQERAMTTCTESSNNFAYMFFNLLGEVGELIEKVNTYVDNPALKELAETLSFYGDGAKTIRKEPYAWQVLNFIATFDKYLKEFKRDTLLHKEIGDIEWQLNGLMTVLGLKAEDICQQNLDKLAKRKADNTIIGEGDNR